MLHKCWILLVGVLLFAACAEPDETGMVTDSDQTEAFFTNISELCGAWFSGQATFPDDPEHTLVATGLRVHVTECGDERIDLNLYRDGGDTWHATWILEMKDNGLHLYHDHIGEKEYPEGEEPLTGYGGYADVRGTSTVQYFPADDHTAEILPEAATNVWMMQLDLESGAFVYYLERNDEPRFRAEVYLES
ncbi:MAG: hypothetical protein ACNA78_00755 [Balneolaceae bacterium]